MHQAREKQSKLIRQWKPWDKSTGAKTAAGKKISCMNAWKHGLYDADMRLVRKLLIDAQYRIR